MDQGAVLDVATPTLVGCPNLFKALQWQTIVMAIPHIKELFGALANRCHGGLVLAKGKAAVLRETAAGMPLSGIYLRGHWQSRGATRGVPKRSGRTRG